MTAVVSQTVQVALNKSNPVQLPNAFKAINAGDFLKGIQDALATPTTLTLTQAAGDTVTLASAPLAILGLAVTAATNNDAEGAYVIAPVGATLTHAGSGAAAGAGQVGTCTWNGTTTITFKTGAAVTDLKVMVLQKPAALASADFSAILSVAP